VNKVEVRSSDSILDRLIQYHSSWYKLKRAVSWILKVKQRLRERVKDGKVDQPKKKEEKGIDRLTTDDLRDAENAIVKFIQQTTFEKEMSTLKGTSQHVKKSSSLYRLDPQLDNNCILRVGGRLSRSAMPEESKHPCILPKHHHVTRLILQDIHTAKGHVGRSYMLSQFRQRFWASRANSTSRSIINQCVVCRRHHGKVQCQKMADLPADRVNPGDPPFSKVGMDYFGPIVVKRGRSMVKRYGVVFTCVASREIHLEKADSLDTDSCINAIRRFVARRGQVQEIRSDNGTNLVGAQRALRAEIQQWNQTQIHNNLLQKNISWKFNPPAASHFGGVWERQIRSVRKVLSSVLNQQTLTDEHLQTLFCEVEAIINGRPITTVSEDANDLEALTPNHLLLMKVQPVLPPTVSAKTDIYARRRWRQVQYLADLFWRRWTKEYLPLLQQRQKWVCPKRNVQVGDVVLVVDDTQPRNSWPLGKVLETMKEEMD
jgi:hypothetical protein